MRCSDLSGVVDTNSVEFVVHTPSRHHKKCQRHKSGTEADNEENDDSQPSGRSERGSRDDDVTGLADIRSSERVYVCAAVTCSSLQLMELSTHGSFSMFIKHFRSYLRVAFEVTRFVQAPLCSLGSQRQPVEHDARLDACLETALFKPTQCTEAPHDTVHDDRLPLASAVKQEYIQHRQGVCCTAAH